MKIPKFCRTLARRWRHERGAVLVEAAIAIPLLLVLILGSVEAGTAWNAKSSTTSGLRSGLLRAAALGDDPATDLRVLQSIVGEVGADKVDRLEWVVIYDASANGGNQQATINACQGNGTPGECVYYPAAILQQIATLTDAEGFRMANFDGGNSAVSAAPPFYSCDGSRLDAQWCATSRPFQPDGSRADVQIGVALSYQHEWLTGIFPGNAPTFSEEGVSSTFQEDGADINASTAFTGQGAAVAFSNDFGGLVGGSGGMINTAGTVVSDESGSGRNVLGLFDNSFNGAPALSVSVDSLPSHSRICISFDLVIFGGWEGASDPFNPTGTEDVIWVTVDNANITGNIETNEEIFRSTYDNNQLSSGTFQSGSNRTDEELVVPISQCIDHVADDAEFDFQSVVSARASDESWAIENLSITTM